MTMALKKPALLREALPVERRWIEADQSGIVVTSRATNEVIGHVPNLGAAETIEAIESVQVVQKTWAERTAKDRSNVLHRKIIRFQVGQFDTTRDDMMMMAHGVVQEVWEQIQ